MRLGELALVALLDHAADQPVVERAEPALALPGRHRAAQAVGLAGREVGGEDRELHHLLLEDRHAARALQRLAHLGAWIDKLVGRQRAAAAGRGGPCRPGSGRGARSRPRSPGRRSSAAAGAAACSSARATRSGTRPPCRRGRSCRRWQRLRPARPASRTRAPALGADEFERTPDRAQHAQREDVDLEQAERVEVVLVPLDDAAVLHRGVLDRHQLGDAVARDDEAARVLAQVARKADQLLREFDPQLRRPARRGRSRSRAGVRGRCARPSHQCWLLATASIADRSRPSALPMSRSAERGR